MPRQSGEGEFLTKEEERRLGESLRKVLISDRPNPSRKGCPDPKTLRDLAFHKRIGNPEVFERATAHVAECSACVRDALEYAEEYKDLRRRRRAGRAALALAAAVVVSIASWAVWTLRQKPRDVETVREVPHDRSPVTPSEIPRYEAVTIALPSRLRGSALPGAPIVLSRGRLLLEIRLPIGSVEGKYKLRIVNKSGKVQKTLEATATTEDHLTRLKVALDTSGLSPGNYTLSVLEPDLDEWIDYTVTVK